MQRQNAEGSLIMKKDTELNSWDDVNKSLKIIGECEIAISTIEAEMNLKINDAKTEADKLIKPLKEQIKTAKEKSEAKRS